VPEVIPHTVPVPLIVPTAVLELIHAPPPLVLVSVTQLPIHTVLGPVIAPGSASTVTTVVV
jgi:hypothetical protein